MADDDVVQKLNDENIRLSLELEAAEKKIQDNQKEIEGLKSENLEQKETLDTLLREMQETLFNPGPDKSEIGGESLSEVCPEDDDTIERLQNEIRTLQEMMTQSGQERDELADRLETSDRARQRLQSCLDEQNIIVDELKNKVAELAPVRQECDALQIQQAAEREQAAKDQSAYHALKKQCDAELAQLKLNLMEKIKTLTVDLEGLYHNNTELKENIRDMNVKIEEMHDALDARDEKIRLLENAAAAESTDAQRQHLQGRVNELVDNLEDVKKRARKMKAYYEDQIAKIKHSVSPVVELTSGVSVNLNDLKQENTQLRQKIFALENQNKNSQDLIIELQNRLADSSGMSQDHPESDKLRIKEITTQELQDTINELKTALNTARQNNTEKEAQLKQLQTQKFNRDKGLTVIVERLEKIRVSLETQFRRKTVEQLGLEFSELAKLIRSL